MDTRHHPLTAKIHIKLKTEHEQQNSQETNKRLRFKQCSNHDRKRFNSQIMHLKPELRQHTNNYKHFTNLLYTTAEKVYQNTHKNQNRIT